MSAAATAMETRPRATIGLRAGPSHLLGREPDHQWKWKVIALLATAVAVAEFGMFAREKASFRFTDVASRPVPATESFAAASEAIATPQPHEEAPATTDEEHDAADVGHADDGAAPPIRPACRAAPDASAERLWLTVAGLAFHGTTALEMLLMSSRALATICSANTWQCEPGWLGNPDDESRYAPLQHELYAAPPKNLAKFLGVALVACALCPKHVCVPAGADGEHVARLVRDELERYAPYWDLRRPVLMTKWAPWKGLLEHVCPPGEEGAVGGREHLGRLQALVPSPALARAGVRRVRWATVLVHRPWCLWPLSHNAREGREQNVTHWAQKELAKIERLAAEHRRHVAEGRPALVVLLADLLWKSRRVARQVERFLPCAGPLDADFAPALGVDITKKNRWKASGSVVEYGAKKDPRALGYDTGGPGIGAGACTQPRDQLYAGLPSEAERRRAEETEAYFEFWTGVDIVGEADVDAEKEIEELGSRDDSAANTEQHYFPQGCSWQCYLANHPRVSKRIKHTEEAALKHYLKYANMQKGKPYCSCKGTLIKGDERSKPEEQVLAGVGGGNSKKNKKNKQKDGNLKRNKKKKNKERDGNLKQNEKRQEK